MAHGHFAQFHAAGRVLLVKQINRFDRPPRGGMALPAGPQWLMIVAYFVLLIIAQGFLSRLLEPIGIAPPDLFLLTGAALAWRWRPVGALLGAFAVGLLQDILGAGVLGLHASGLAGGALLVLAVRRWLPGGGWRRLALTVAAALAGQWLTFTILTYVLRTNLVTVPTLLRVVPMTFLTTFLIGWSWESLMTYLLGRPQEGLD